MEIVVENLTFAYEDKEVLRGVSMLIPQGKLTVILGPSGCGKTTLLRCISGLESRYKGDIYMSGKNVRSTKPSERNISMIFQDFALYQTMTVKDNIGLSLVSRGMPKEQINSKVVETARMLGIVQLLSKKVTKLSGGEKQRVAIARSFVRSPKLLLLDEPFANLDIDSKKQVRSEFKKHQSGMGVTSVMVTHDQNEAIDLADQMVVMNDGEILQTGSIEDIYYRPRCLFVARFIGETKINIFETKKVDGILGESSTRYIAIRPEKIRLHNNTISPDDYKIRATLCEQHLAPPYTHFAFKADFGQISMITTENIILSRDSSYDLAVSPKDIIHIAE